MPAAPGPGPRSTPSAPADAARGRRADARRNIAAIQDAAVTSLAANPEASIGEIAAAAGVGRVTLYGHFSSRAELIDSVFARTVEQADQALDAVNLGGDPRAALARLIESTWQLVDQFRALLMAAQRALPPERIRDLHDRPMNRVRGLVERGRDEGVFRSDLPAPWLVATFYSVLHGAAGEIAVGRIAEHDAAALITSTVLSAFAPPDAPAGASASPQSLSGSDRDPDRAHEYHG